ncbi:MAG: hypothetical protein COV44_02080 [Deltaproteobacteria bacterium CG11_big_fil_rev_8_21_14_0_20_45_16]|nr:MAG: hypothetical protein COV44_02080 [Deltaproteobacteria bacterium CG11_big_fil_rev_8_21_14_0_20_45_16]
MSKYYAKSQKGYEEAFEFDTKKILEAMKRAKKGRKVPTSIALEPATIKNLKSIADKIGVPYQVLMRLFILEGLKRVKTA